MLFHRGNLVSLAAQGHPNLTGVAWVPRAGAEGVSRLGRTAAEDYQVPGLLLDEKANKGTAQSQLDLQAWLLQYYWSPT